MRDVNRKFNLEYNFLSNGAVIPGFIESSFRGLVFPIVERKRTNQGPKALPAGQGETHLPGRLLQSVGLPGPPRFTLINFPAVSIPFFWDDRRASHLAVCWD